VHRVANGIYDRVLLAVPQPTEWQRIGEWIDAAMIFSGSDFVKGAPRSMKVANRPDYTECLNETATNRDPCKNQNSISNPSIVIGDTNVQSISRVNSPMLLALHKSQKST